MTEDEYKAFVAHAKSGTLLIGIDRAFARRFYTDVPLTRIKEETGEAPYFEKIVVWFAFISAPIALLASFILSVLAFRWWAVLAIPLSAIVYFGFAGDSSRGQTRMLGVSIVLALAIASLFTNFFSSQCPCLGTLPQSHLPSGPNAWCTVEPPSYSVRSSCGINGHSNSRGSTSP